MPLMFGAGFQKILLLIAIVTAVWYGFRWIGRLAAERKALQRVAKRNRPASRGIEDMVRCRLCGDYVPATGVTSCSRANCPNR